MTVKTSRFVNILTQIRQIGEIYNHLRLWIAVARHNLKWLKIEIILLNSIRVKKGTSLLAANHNIYKLFGHNTGGSITRHAYIHSVFATLTN